MTEDTKDFIDSWKGKIALINNNDLNALFDRFSTYYILHNRLYNDSYRILNRAGKLSKLRYADHEKASIAILEYLTPEVIFNRFVKNKIVKDLELVASLIQNKIFNINLADGVANRDIDEQLMVNLRSNDPTIATKAALMAVYNVRSNMVHGEKHFEEHQRILLEPLIRILETVTELQIESYG